MHLVCYEPALSVCLRSAFATTRFAKSKPFAVQLSKEVRALKLYERMLLDGYHTFLQALQQVSKWAVKFLAHSE